AAVARMRPERLQFGLDPADQLDRKDECRCRPGRRSAASGRGVVAGLVVPVRLVGFADQDAGWDRLPGRRRDLEGHAVVDAEVVELLGLAEQAQAIERQGPARYRL